MRMYESVVVVTDPHHYELAAALRGVLDAFRLHCDFRYCVQRQKLREVLGGACEPAEYVVLCCGGWHPPASPALSFLRLVDVVDGEWQTVGLDLTPEEIGRSVHLSGRKLIVLGGCNGGTPVLVDAFLESGVTHYVAETGEVNGVDADAALLFVIGLFYNLLLEERGERVSFEKAVRRAAAMDPVGAEGTWLYRCYNR